MAHVIRLASRPRLCLISPVRVNFWTLWLRLEYRRDWSNANVFLRNGGPTGHQNTFTVGWVYAFSTRQ
jgi:hypothetical protein